jgi:DNA-directed RNA polymerase beta' subunit
VIVNRAPSLSPTAHLAFHPVRVPGSAIRLHPLATGLLNADFDGDQVAVFLPLTEAAQREAGERLTVAAHLARDPSLIETVLPPPEALWGLAYLGLSEYGLREVAELAGAKVGTSRGVITRATLAEALLLARSETGQRAWAEAVLAALERLTARGLEIAQASGASMSPFLGESLERLPLPQGADEAAWSAYREALTEQIVTSRDYADLDLGVQRLAVNVRARGRHHLPALIGPAGPVVNAEGETVVIRHSRVEGLTPDELYAKAAGARQGLAELARRWEGLGYEMRQQDQAEQFTLLARARRASHPGIVFARAAVNGEIDPLEESESRLLVGKTT